jgi:hypothetical protein
MVHFSRRRPRSRRPGRADRGPDEVAAAMTRRGLQQRLVRLLLFGG